MDRKSIILLGICGVLFVGWYYLMSTVYAPNPALVATNRMARATDSTASTNRAPAAASRQTSARDETPASLSARPLPVPAAPETLVVLENENARYTFTSQGGGLKLVALKNYPESVACGTQKKTASTNWATLNTRAPMPAMALFGTGALQGDGLFELHQTTNGVVAEKTLTNGLRLVKEFQLGTNYLLTAKVRVENRSGEPIKVPPQEWVIGTATPMSTNDPTTLVGVYWHDGNSDNQVGETWFANKPFLGCLGVPSSPRTEFENPGNRVVWTAVHNQFFTVIAMPKEPAAKIRVRWLWQTRSGEIEFPPAQDLAAKEARYVKSYGFQSAFVYPETVLKPEQFVERHYQIFAGPKEYKTLARLGNEQHLVMGFSGFFGWFAQVLLFSMNQLHDWGLGYGLTIIAITIVIKTLFWPLTIASTRSMKRMAALQPQMKALQEKYKDDPKKMNQKLMEFMKEHKVSPLGGCLPMVLQIPVFFGFYRMLQSAIELRGAPFLWACDLSRSDTVYIIPGFNFPVNPLPLVMGATMLWQARLTPPSPGVDPMQQKIMKYMPLMFMVFLYNFSAGLTLYWTVQNLLTIAQMKLTKAVDVPGAPKPTAVPVRPILPPRKKK
jgi:YidC/Oxa1 family membrane protein insertase